MAAPTAVPTATEPPFVGLKAYTEDQANRFFGRDHECETLIGNLRGARLTLLYAESGVGKSSLLRAGLTAELRRNARRHLEAGRAPRLLPVLFSGYSEDPVQGVMDAVTEAVRPFAGGLPPLGAPSIAGVLEQAAAAAGTTVLVLLDQFEEYFLYRSRHPDTDRFADEIAACVRRRDLNANFLISIREDSYARLGDLFRGRIDDVYSNFLHLDHLGRAGGEEAIRGPVNWYNGAYDTGVVVEDALVKAVLDGVRLDKPGRPADGDAGDHIETTYLQLVMERVWDEEMREGSSCLRAETLRQMGGPRAVIAGHLDHTMDRFSDDDQRAAAAAFRFLVTRSGTKIALSVGDLSELSEVEATRLDPLLRRLAEPDVHILRPVELRDSEDSSYEIYHDALGRPILEWRAGRQQREEAARSEALALEVERERAEKERAQQLEAEAQRQKAEAEQRAALELRRKRIAVGALIGLVTACALAAFAIVTLSERANTRKYARAETSSVIAAKLDDLSRPLFGEGQEALAAFEAYRLSPTFDARKRVQAALQDNAGMPVVLSGHRLPVIASAWGPAPAGLLATGSADGTVRLWRADGRPDGPPLIHGRDGARVTGLAFSPNGELLAVSRDSGAVDFWSLDDRPTFLQRLPASTALVCATEDPCQPIAFAPDGETLAAVRHDDVLALWPIPGQDPRRVRPPATVHVGEQGIHSLAFSRDGARLAVGSQGGVTVWRVADGRARHPLRLRGGASDAYSVAWSPSGALAAATDSGVLRWGPTGTPLKRLLTAVPVFTVGFVLGGAQIATGGYDQQVTTWDARTRRVVGAPRPHASIVETLAVSPDGTRILAGDDAAVAKIWHVQSRNALAVNAPALYGSADLAALPGGLLATYRPAFRSLRLWRLQGPPDAPRPPAPVAQLRVDGVVATGGSRVVGIRGPSGKKVTVWDVRGACRRMPAGACRQGRRLPISGDLGMTLALDRSGTILAVGGDRGRLTLWNIRNLRAPRRLAQTQIGKVGFEQLAFDPGARIVLERDNETVRLLSYAGRGHRLVVVGRPLHGQGRAALNAAAFSPSGRTLAVGGDDQTVTLLGVVHPARPRELGTLAQSNAISSLAFSPDGATLAAGDADGKACVYDVRQLRATGSKTCLVSPSAFGGGDVAPLVFDRTGRTLVTEDGSSDITLWSSLLWTQAADKATTRRLNAAVCRLAGRNLNAGEWAAVFSGTELAGERRKTCQSLPLG